MSPSRVLRSLAGLALLPACGDDAVTTDGPSGGPVPSDTSTSTGATPTTGAPTTTTTTTTSSGSDGETTTTTTITTTTGGTTDGVKLDVGFGTTGDPPPVDRCKVQGDDAVGDCEMEAPPDSFMPAVQWAFAGQDDELHAVATPLVANMTDDNGDGVIDLCDVPDVVVPLYGNAQSDGHLYILDGLTGAVHLKIPDIIDGYANPAIGDIDGDGLPEIVTIRSEVGDIINGHAIAFEHDGTFKWESPVVFDAWQVAVALADLDADGDVEIMAGRAVLDHLGAQLFLGNSNGAIDIPFAADLDGDGDLEVLQGGDAFHHDGSVYYSTPVAIAHPQVGNLDDDPEPEVLLAGFNGLSLLEHDGTIVYQDQNPSGDASWWRPAAIHDVDGDGAAEILVSSNQHYNIYRPDLTLLWTASVQDNSGFAAGTAFDFLGAGYAQAMYADEQFLFVYGEGGAVLLSSPRSSWTQAENPVVADVDDDGSAEIVVVSNGGLQPAVQVVRDVEDRWIQARRIWNQHAYHVTNVREDGTIPQHQTPSWQALNTFRTNAQIEGGAVCMPDPPG
ncbi:hypothetical protein SAMN02745121_00770 [Nannocystis exedens]|uniref:Repeat domain-containing protein n=1 Tax=Nannocystis exedens TaxID=54 RepID=A0A1I1TRK7_9BACT|nr:VCBS repeat-containing protein [Nannocystis exedens]PCC66501.1 FG-GAP repeat/HVR domain protein [Nannocystis exedens]SFD59083.1 hypothetical protein SAMN02745121_00770 [Nannocystis exedens]